MIPRMFSERRFGRFYVPSIIRMQFPHTWMAILRDKIVTRAEYLLAEDALEYVAYCEDFDPIPENTAPKNYDLNIHLNYVQVAGGKVPTTIKWSLTPHQPAHNSIYITSSEDKSELTRRYYQNVTKNGDNNNEPTGHGEAGKIIQS